VVAASPNRRSFLKTLGAASAGVAALSLAEVPKAHAVTATEIEGLQFALNLEYLESEFYSYAVHGKGIESFGVGISGQANGSNSTSGGITTGAAQVNFNNNTSHTQDIAIGIGEDERAHVTLLRSALGGDVIAKPNINLNALGLSTGKLNDYLRQARIFEDIGTTAYAGTAGLLSTASVITTAARILAAEGQHTASLRTLIDLMSVTTTAIDGADILPPPSGQQYRIASLYVQNGLVATRTPQQILYRAFGNKDGATSGGFFPYGVNGAITTSGAAATSANLNT